MDDICQKTDHSEVHPDLELTASTPLTTPDPVIPETASETTSDPVVPESSADEDNTLDCLDLVITESRHYPTCVRHHAARLFTPQ